MNWITVEDTVEPEHPYAPIAVSMASSILFNLTGEKFQGVHTVTEYYSKDVDFDGTYRPALIGGEMYNLPASSRAGTVTRASLGDRNLYLRHTPIRSVQSVTIDGRTLAPEEYSIRNRAYLVRSGNTRWNFDLNSEIIVEYSYGAPPPPAGVAAAIRLANELIFAEMGDDRCALPTSVTSVDRQNVSITVTDPQQFLNDGKVGIYSVDLFIKTYNPSGSRKKTKLAIAGRPRSERIN